jgi:hypothetical protein
LTAGTFGTRVSSLLINSNATTPATSNVWIFILRGSTVMPLGLIPVAVSAGNVTGTRNIDALNNVNILGLPVDNTGKLYIPLMGGDLLKCSLLATLTAGGVWVTAMGADYQS